MFFSKCKKCGGKKVSIITNIDIEIHGTMRKATNVPAKQCEKCGDIVVNDIILERLKNMPMIIHQGILIMQNMKRKKAQRHKSFFS